jgi:hypothetical protein
MEIYTGQISLNRIIHAQFTLFCSFIIRAAVNCLVIEPISKMELVCVADCVAISETPSDWSPSPSRSA